MKIDNILKEELWRSIPVYIVSFLAIGILISVLSPSLPLSSVFPLALIPTAIHFLFMVRYRRKEHLTNPVITNILRHAFGTDKNKGIETGKRREFTGKLAYVLLIIVIYLAYIYASLVSGLNQVFWLPVLFVICLLLIGIVFIEDGRYRFDPFSWACFYLILVGLVIIRHLTLDYALTTVLGLIVLIGIISGFFFLLKKNIKEKSGPARAIRQVNDEWR